MSIKQFEEMLIKQFEETKIVESRVMLQYLGDLQKNFNA